MNATYRGFVECLDHVKHVASWTTMVYHAYDHVYYKVLTIAICDSLKTSKFNDLCGQNLMK